MTDTALQRAGRHIDTQIMEPFRQVITSRKFFSKIVTIPKGKMLHTFNQIVDMGDAVVNYSMPSIGGPSDKATVTPVNIDLAVISEDYEIPWEEVEAFNSNGQNIEAANAISAAYKVAKKENAVLMNGHAPDGTNYVTLGLEQAANNTASGADFGTYGNALASVEAGLAAIDNDDAINGLNHNLGLPGTQYYELLGSVSTAGEREMPQVLEMLSENKGAPPGGIYKIKDTTANQGLLAPNDPHGSVMDLVVMQDVTNVLGQDSRLPGVSPVYARTYEILAPRYKQCASTGKTDAICTITGI